MEEVVQIVEEPQISPVKRRLQKFKRKLLGKYLKQTRAALAFIVIILLVGLVLQVKNALVGTKISSYASLAHAFIATPRNAINSVSARTNVLILGKGGEGHTAPDLTDTIILASFKHDSPETVTFISLPRDIWIEDLRTKLNSVYYWGNKKQEFGGGLILAKSTVEEIAGIPVHYAAVIDFSGFVKVIDAVGGVDIEVIHSFIDTKYPIPGKENDECDGLTVQAGDEEFACRYETLEFKKGLIHMNGATALKFARSRQSEDKIEGTDIAREKRQQQVLGALKNKLTSREIYLSPQKMLQLYNLSQEIIETDLSPEAEAILARRVLEAKDNIGTHILPEELLINPPITKKYDNLYVFIPKDESWDEIANWVERIFR